MSTVQVTLRLPVEVSEKVREEALQSGITVRDAITHALQSHYGLSRDSNISLRKGVADWVGQSYTKSSFPPDIILIVTRHIRDTPSLHKKYQAAIQGANGVVDKYKRQRVNQQIGRCVKAAVEGEVFGRSMLLNTSDDLIQSYSFLKPSP